MMIYESDLRVGDVIDLKELVDRKNLIIISDATRRAVEKGLFEIKDIHDTTNLFGDPIRKLSDGSATIAVHPGWLVDVKEW